MATLREGYAVGGDDTAWRRYIMDSMSELGICADMQGAQISYNPTIGPLPTRNSMPYVKKPKDNLEDFHDTVQKLIGGITI